MSEVITHQQHDGDLPEWRGAGVEGGHHYHHASQNCRGRVVATACDAPGSISQIRSTTTDKPASRGAETAASLRVACPTSLSEKRTGTSNTQCNPEIPVRLRCTEGIRRAGAAGLPDRLWRPGMRLVHQNLLRAALQRVGTCEFRSDETLHRAPSSRLFLMRAKPGLIRWCLSTSYPLTRPESPRRDQSLRVPRRITARGLVAGCTTLTIPHTGKNADGGVCMFQRLERGLIHHQFTQMPPGRADLCAERLRDVSLE